MVEEIDILRTAKVLTDTEGDHAVFYAAQRADSLLDHGDLEGAALWRRIKSAIEELLNLEPPNRPTPSSVVVRSEPANTEAKAR